MKFLDSEEYRAALNLYSIERYEESARRFLDYLRSFREKGVKPLGYPFWEVWCNLANAFASAGRFRKAETCYLNAIKCFRGRRSVVLNGGGGLGKDAGIVFYNYACMCFFLERDALQTYKAYVLFELAAKSGFKHVYTGFARKALTEIYADVVAKSVKAFYDSRAYRVLSSMPEVRDFLEAA